MNKQEFSKWVMALKTYYPREQLLPNAQAIELWFQELHDIPMHVAEAALRKWVATSKWSPTIAEIREMCVDVKRGDAPDWSEGWMKVNMAIQRYGRYRPAEAMASLDPITRKAVKCLGFHNLCDTEDIGYYTRRFQQIFETEAKREQMCLQLPIGLQDTIRSIQGEFKLMIESGDNANG